MAEFDQNPENETPNPDAEVQGPEAEPVAEEAANRALGDALRTAFWFLKVAMVCLVIGYLLTGVFWVKFPEIKFKMSFGRVVRGRGGKLVMEPESGVHLRWPWEEVVVLTTDEQTLNLDTEFWYAENQGHIAGRRSLSVRTDGYLLTGDANIVHMKCRVRYRIPSDAEGVLSYRLKVQDPEDVLRRAVMAATSKVVGSKGVMDVIQRNTLFSDIETELKRRLRTFEDRTGCPLGVEVVKVEAIETQKVKNPTEPVFVRDAFYQAQMAESEKDQLMREGEAEASKILGVAEAGARRIREDAAADKVRLVRSAKADADAMNEILPIYRQSKAVANIVRTMFYQRVMEEVMFRSSGMFVLYGQDGGERELRLLHSLKPVQKPKTAQEIIAGH